MLNIYTSFNILNIKIIIELKIQFNDKIINLYCIDLLL